MSYLWFQSEDVKTFMGGGINININYILHITISNYRWDVGYNQGNEASKKKGLSINQLEKQLNINH